MRKVDITRREHWASLIQEADDSGLTRRAWCAQNGVTLAQSYRWQRKLKGNRTGCPTGLPNEPVPIQAISKGPVFCELPIPEPTKQTDEDYVSTESFAPELMLRYGQFRLLIGNSINRKTLETVLSVLRHV